MKLIYFSNQTLPRNAGGPGEKAPRITFATKGCIRLNPSAVKLMGLKHGDKITMSQDEEATENFYLFKDQEHGFEVRTASDKKSLIFNHSSLVGAFLEAVGRDSSITQRFLLAGTPTVMAGDKAKTQYWGILINS